MDLAALVLVWGTGTFLYYAMREKIGLDGDQAAMWAVTINGGLFAFVGLTIGTRVAAQAPQ